MFATGLTKVSKCLQPIHYSFCLANTCHAMQYLIQFLHTFCKRQTRRERVRDYKMSETKVWREQCNNMIATNTSVQCSILLPVCPVESVFCQFCEWILVRSLLLLKSRNFWRTELEDKPFEYGKKTTDYLQLDLIRTDEKRWLRCRLDVVHVDVENQRSW
jgi:hypothetical protein